MLTRRMCAAGKGGGEEGITDGGGVVSVIGWGEDIIWKQRAHQASALSGSPRRTLKSPSLSAMRDASGPSAGNRLQTRWRSYRASLRPALQ
jgi:hypothetical protein